MPAYTYSIFILRLYKLYCFVQSSIPVGYIKELFDGYIKNEKSKYATLTYTNHSSVYKSKSGKRDVVLESSHNLQVFMPAARLPKCIRL